MPDMEEFSDETDDDRTIRFVIDRLADELDRPNAHGEMKSAVESEFRRLANARVREFVPVFVERRVRTALRTSTTA